MIFFAPRGCKIFFAPIDCTIFLAPRGCVIFCSQAKRLCGVFFSTERLRDSLCVKRLRIFLCLELA